MRRKRKIEKIKKIYKTEMITICGIVFQWKSHIEKRMDARISIRGKNINIRFPITMTEKQRDIELKKLLLWAEDKIGQNKDFFQPATGTGRYKDGDILILNKESILLRIIRVNLENSHACMEKITDCKQIKNFNNRKKIINIDSIYNTDTTSENVKNNSINRQILIRLAKDQTAAEEQRAISHLISRVIAKYRLPYLQKKIEDINNKYFQKKIGKISFKNNKTNWGSCSSIGNINISTRLLFAPEEVLEYVCIHELAHLIEPNHSKKFWSLVANIMPDYKDKELWLKKNAHKYIF